MITKRLVILLSLLLLGLGSVFALPKHIKLQPAAVDPVLPDYIGSWQASELPVTQMERDLLGPDTRISRKLYSNMTGDEVFISIVLSGPDMNTSIHRPER